MIHLLDNRFITSQYINTRQLFKNKGSDILPPFSKKYKVDHELRIILELKHDFDGSTDQSQYNLKFAKNDSSTQKSDASFFATTLVPLRMTAVDNSKTIIWNNATPQSPRWCRSLRLQFEKETPELTLKEKASVEAEIDALIPFSCAIAGVKVTVVYKLYLTMIDGKVLQVITKTKSNQTCCVCKATPTQFNKLHNVSTRFKPVEGTLNFGISPLQFWIRSFEFLLHVSYRKSLEIWQVRGKKTRR